VQCNLSCCCGTLRGFAGKSDGGEPTTAAAASLDDGAKCTTVEGLFLFALVWSMGGTVDVDGRIKFDNFLR
jgi:hypothetical protein